LTVCWCWRSFSTAESVFAGLRASAAQLRLTVATTRSVSYLASSGAPQAQVPWT